MHDVAVILLAAGLSRRMGERNKLLLSIGGEIILKRVMMALTCVADCPVTVVTGHERSEIVSALGSERANFVHNPRYELGQMTSVDAGLRRAPEAQTTILALGDQPFLSAFALETLLAAHRQNANGRITIPFVNGARGNPIVIPQALRRRMIDDPVNLGCRGLTRDHPELVNRFKADLDCFVQDVDTPQDLRVFQTNQLEGSPI